MPERVAAGRALGAPLSAAPARILVIRRKALGDLVVSMGVPAALRRAWPEARIELLVDVAVAPVVRGSALVDSVVIYDRRDASAGGAGRRLATLRRWLQGLRDARYDLVLDLMSTPQTALWTRATGAPIRVGRRRRWRSWAYTRLVTEGGGAPRFAGEVFLDWVRAIGIEPGAWQPQPLVLDERSRAGAATFFSALPGRGGPRVILNPSATWPAKAWPLQHFATLARLLANAMQAQVLVAWGPGEEPLRDAIVTAAEGAAEGLPPSDIPQMAALLAAADLVITTDSGPKHVAMAMGTPTLTLFGSTDPRGWQPDREDAAWITHDVACRPCDLTVCPVPGHPCLDALQPATVLEAARMLLARQAGARARGRAGA